MNMKARLIVATIYGLAATTMMVAGVRHTPNGLAATWENFNTPGPLAFAAGMALAVVSAILAMQPGDAPALNASTRRVGGIRFFKIGRLCFSFCVTRAYRPISQ